MTQLRNGTKIIYRGQFVDTPTPDAVRVRNGAILVEGDNGHGIIADAVWQDDNNVTLDQLIKDKDFPSDAAVLSCSDGGFFFPGFIDTHIHAPQYPNLGIFGKSTLLDWLTTYTFPLESSLGSLSSPMWQSSKASVEPTAPLDRARHVYEKVISRTLSNGTTTASYFATLHVDTTNLLTDIALQRGQRAYIGRVCMDLPETCPDFYRDESTEQTMLNTKAVIEHCQKVDPTGQLVAPILTPRFSPSCRVETLAELGKLAQSENLRVQTHISENTDELKLVKSLFPDREHYTDTYDHFGLLTDKTILAHGIHLSDEEMQIIKQRKSKISHCPASNTALGSGLCPVRKLLDAGIDVSLGTDVSGGYSSSILDAVRQCCLVSRQLGYIKGGDKRWNIGVAEGLWLATVGGAKCVDLAGRTGVFEVGALWDVQEIQLRGEDSPVDVFEWQTGPELVDKWVWNGDDRNVKRVWVGGKLVHERK